MPVISIDIHRIEASRKEGLIRELTRTAADIAEVPESAFVVLINELEDENIGIGGRNRAAVMKKGL